MHPHQYLQTHDACSQTRMHAHTDNTYLHTYTEAELTAAVLLFLFGYHA